LKDDKTYPYIKITAEMFPRVIIVRKVQKDNGKYFGPYTSGLVMKETLDIVHNLFSLRTCKRKFPKELNNARECLNFHIGKCSGPCNEHVSQEAYNNIIKEIISFLEAKYDSLIKAFTNEMEKASESLQFEKAALFRDRIEIIKNLSDKQKVDTIGIDDQDVIAVAKGEKDALVQIFFIRNGKMIGRENFLLDAPEFMPNDEIISAFIKQFYSETSFIPKEILLEADISDRELTTKWLSSIRERPVTILVPQKGKKHGLIKLASKNAHLTLETFGEELKRQKQRTLGALEELSRHLGIDKALTRIEAYDISNIMGYESVGAMVVFEKGKPKRDSYRKFKIKHVFGADDYASMAEVLERRFKRYKDQKEDVGFSKLPDILMIDGGKGHVNTIKTLLTKLELDILVCGMVKDDYHKTRGLFFNNEEISFNKNSESFKLITRIQDEVHRFAIEYHRTLRKKETLRSMLDEIEGIGEIRRKALYKAFGDINKIKTASIEELSSVDKMNKQVATKVYEFFRRN